MLVPRRIIAVGLGLFYLDVFLRPDAYTSGTYTVLRDIAPLNYLAALLLAGAILLAVTRTWHATAVMVALLGGWAIGLGSAVVTGDSESPAGWVFVAMVAALLYWGIGRTNPEG